MTTQVSTCTKPTASGEMCGGAIRPSRIEAAGAVLGVPRQPAAETVQPAQCERCATPYPDVVSVPMTGDDLQLIGQRVGESTRQRLKTVAKELTPASFQIEITEHDARDLASKAANLGLLPLAQKIRHELNGLTMERRGR